MAKGGKKKRNCRGTDGLRRKNEHLKSLTLPHTILFYKNKFENIVENLFVFILINLSN